MQYYMDQLEEKAKAAIAEEKNAAKAEGEEDSGESPDTGRRYKIYFRAAS